MVKLNIFTNNDSQNSNKSIQDIQRPGIKKNKKTNQRSTLNNPTVSSKIKSVLDIFLTQQTPKKVALHKSFLSQKLDQDAIDQELGPSFHELIQLGVKFSQKEIYSIGLRLIHTLRFFHNNNKVCGGVFPKNLYFSKNLQQFYLTDLSRCENIDYSDENIKYFGKSADSNFLQDAILYGSENLKQNIIPFPRDQIQNILYFLYYLECNLHQKKYKKSEIRNSTNLKELYSSLKQFKYNEKIMTQPIITYFSSKAKSLEINDLFFQRIQIQKLRLFLIENSHRQKSFSTIIENLNREDQHFQKVKQGHSNMLFQMENCKIRSSTNLDLRLFSQFL